MSSPRLLVICALFLLPSCAGDSFSSGGGEGGSGGSQDGTGGTPSCAKLGETYLRTLLQARACDPDDENSCSDSETLLDRCGCEVPVNAGSDATETAENARAAYEDAGCPAARPASCPDTCPEITSEYVASCQQTGGSTFACDWVN
jgi:hypothetical protein